ncbi:uncharacterized protein LOC135844531 [Planococcus citri]|uniref:uncharacterized protein LOC135844531 n=1 Tax=Planococcus citri TaxID=170843 RepID=UPI0031F8778D
MFRYPFNGVKFDSRDIKMYFFLILSFFQLMKLDTADPGENDGLIANKINGEYSWEYSFPKYVEKLPDGSMSFIPPETSGAVTYLLCPEKDTPEKKANKYCLRGKKLKEVEDRVCHKPPLPNIAKIFKNYEHVECGHEVIGRLYSFQYVVCSEEDKELPWATYLNVYQICYDNVSNRFLYASVVVDTPNLLTNTDLESERAINFEYEDDGYFSFDDYFSKTLSPMYQEVLQNDEIPYVPQIIASPDFTPFALTRKTSFHWINVAPMHKDIVETWKKFISHLTQLVSERNPIIVHSGIHDPIGEKGFPRYLIRNQIAIPFFWWIMLQGINDKTGVVFVMHNLAPDEKREPKLCDESVCGKAGLHEMITNFEEEFAIIYCCPASVLSEILRIEPVVDELMVFGPIEREQEAGVIRL